MPAVSGASCQALAHCLHQVDGSDRLSQAPSGAQRRRHLQIVGPVVHAADGDDRQSGRSARKAQINSIPSISGITMSVTTASICRSRKRSSASRPLMAVTAEKAGALEHAAQQGTHRVVVIDNEDRGGGRWRGVGHGMRRSRGEGGLADAGDPLPDDRNYPSPGPPQRSLQGANVTLDLMEMWDNFGESADSIPNCLRRGLSADRQGDVLAVSDVTIIVTVDIDPA